MSTRRQVVGNIAEVGGHLFFWVSVYLLYLYVFGYNTVNEQNTRVFSTYLMPITMVSSYVFVYYLIPRYLIIKQYSRFLLYSVYTFILTAFALVISVFYALIFMLDLQVAQMPVVRNLPFILVTVYLVVFLASGISLLRHFYSSSAGNERLKTKVLEAQLKLKEQELKYLKMQIHPHFLFNTLNTLYGFAMAQAKETPDMILRLSNLLDYILYQTDKPKVNLSTEVAHIRDYIELEEVRFNDVLNVQLDIDDIPSNVMVAPMVFIPFVENAFKHGGRSAEQKLLIQLSIRCEGEKVLFEINNSLDQDKVMDRERGGIGLVNIEKRLEMLYPDRHVLSVLREESNFRVKLTLETDG